MLTSLFHSLTCVEVDVVLFGRVFLVAEMASGTWLGKKRSGSAAFVGLLAFTGAWCSLFQVRMWWLGCRRARKRAARLSKAFAMDERVALASKPTRTNGDSQRSGDSAIMNLIACQFSSVFVAKVFEGRSCVCCLLLGHTEYVGNTSLAHSHARDIGGVTTRWEQHMRKLYKHRNGKGKNRRSRYTILMHRHVYNFLMVFAAFWCESAVAVKHESYTIAEVLPNANSLLHTPVVKAYLRRLPVISVAYLGLCRLRRGSGALSHSRSILRRCSLQRFVFKRCQSVVTLLYAMMNNAED